MSDTGGGRKWLKYGCLGCLGCVALVAVVLAVFVGVVALQARSQTVETRKLEHAVPVVAPEPEDPRAASGAGQGRVILRLSQASFFVEPAAPGEPLQVRARYDSRSYDLKEDFQQDAPDADWTYRLDFSGRGGSLMQGLREWLGGTRPEVRIFLPPDARLALDMEVSQGGFESDLGGLWLTEVDVSVQQGGFEMEFARPLREPLQRLSVRTAMGGASLVGVGNGSPRRIDLDASMGGLEVDLRGAWSVDSALSIKTRMGGVEVRLPQDVHVVGVDAARLPAAPDPERPRPTLTVTVDAEMGGVEFVGP